LLRVFKKPPMRREASLTGMFSSGLRKGGAGMIRGIALIVGLLFSQVESREESVSIDVPFDSIKGLWGNTGKYGAPKDSFKMLPRIWPYDTFEIRKSKSRVSPMKFNNQYVTGMSRRGYFANSFVVAFSNGLPNDSLILYHLRTNSCGEHLVLYYAGRDKGDIVIRRIVPDTMYLAINMSDCKNNTPIIDTNCHVYVKQKHQSKGTRR